MRMFHMAIWTALASSLAAQGNDPGFRWLALRAGSISFDPQENVKAAPLFGAQGGVVFDQQRFGLSFEGLVAHPKSDLLLDKSLNHSELSVTLMTGLSGDPSSRFWPYLGLGLGAISVPKVAPSTLVVESTKGSAAHFSLGVLHRPFRGFIWGLEGRYLLTFTPKDFREVQGSVLFGFTWGGQPATPRMETVTPPPEAKVPAPSIPIPVVIVAPVPQPVVEKALPPAAPRPVPVVETVPPKPVPRPAAVVEVFAPPPPAPVVAPVPATAPSVPAAPTPVIAPPSVRHKEPPATSTMAGSTLTERSDALLLGDMAKSLELGRRRIEAIPARHWTIRLEIADLPGTLKNAVAAFPAGKADLFIAPIKLRGGKTSYQLFLGDYPSKADAERAAKAVPSFFLEGGQRPKPILGSAILTQ